MIKITIKNYENNSSEAFAKAVKRFSKKVAKDGILRDLKQRRYYNKPSDIKRAKIKTIQRKRMLNARKRREKR